MKIRIIGVGGSMANKSTSLAALKIALSAAEAAGAEVKLYDVREMNLPMYDPALQSGAPPRAQEFAEDAHCSHGMIWSSPLYHGTISGSFKNALDWLNLLGKQDPPYLTDQVIGLISAAGGVHGLQAVNTMEFIVRSLRAYAVPLVLPIAKSWQVFDENNQIKDKTVEGQLNQLGAEVYRAALQFATEGNCDYKE